MAREQFGWIDFYTELATELLGFKADRTLLIRKLQQVYSNIEMKMPKLESGDELIDIDPFTVFGLFNKGITNENRTLIAKGMADEFGVKADVPSDYAGIPVLNNLKATFYFFKDDRGKHDIDNLWEVFDAALKLAENDTAENRQTFSNFYDIVRGQLGIRWNITMALYWVRPYSFLNLDSRNRQFIMNPENMPADFVTDMKGKLNKVPTAAEYLEIRDSCAAVLQSGKYEYRSFPELSYHAWVVSEKDNLENGYSVGKSRRESAGAALADEGVDQVHYWLYAPGHGAEKWEEMYQDGNAALGWGEIGDVLAYSGKDEIRKKMKEVYGGSSSYRNSAHAVWQFAREMKVGDIIFAKKGKTEIVGRGVVESDYIYEESRPDYYPHLRKIKWTHKGNWILDDKQLAMKTLTDITPYEDVVSKLKALFEDDAQEEEEEAQIIYKPYSPEEFLREVFMSEDQYHMLVSLVRSKKNVILQGAPGVGKTFVAKRLAYSMMGEKDTERVEMVQFHQSYSYEDFIEGFRPTTAGGFELKKGAFYKFCKRAEIDSDNEYFFIIDEINRGNLSKIFGELFMLIENDKRDIELQLLYSGEKFAVPGNVYLIGMMNTADRSLAMLDYALRRRFAFVEIRPGFDTDGFREYRMSLDNDKFNRLIACVESLNRVIADDESLGEGFCIGHSYFCNFTADELDEQRLTAVVEFELIPLLKEYWFDEPMKIKDWSEKLRGAIR